MRTAAAPLPLTVFACALWLAFPWLGGWPVAIVLIPWAARAFSGQPTFPLKASRWGLLLVFAAAAAVGLWAAYDPGAAWDKFWGLLLAGLLYAAAAAQGWRGLLHLTWGIAVLAAGVGVVFLLGADWQAQPADLPWLGALASRLTALRPPWAWPAVQANLAGGLMAASLPFALALTVRARRDGRPALFWLSAALAAVIAFGLMMTSSRGAWSALGVGLAFAGLLALVRWLSRLAGTTRVMLGTAAVGVVVVLLLGGSLVARGGLDGFSSRMMALPSMASRGELARNTLALIRDFPFTGGGLAAFPGLYSRYMLSIPVFLFGYSHNLYLDLALEQGLAGLLALLGLYSVALWALLRGLFRQKREDEGADLLRLATIAGIITVLAHGLVDDPLYGMRGLPVLLLLPGMAEALGPADDGARRASLGRRRRPSGGRRWAVALGGVALLLVLMLALGPRRLAAAWLADLGGVEMSRAELRGWPGPAWEDRRDQAGLQRAESLFERALVWDARNRTAHHRLGLMAMDARAFDSAAGHLETALAESPGHRGVRKVLGYAYLWMGNESDAMVLLGGLPEAAQELQVYAWWWTTQGRDDLAGLASQAAESAVRGP